MRYLLLVYTDERLLPEFMTPEVFEQFEALGRELLASRRLVMTGGLAATDAATTVRVRGGEVLVTDGPFAETHEQLGGFSLAEFDSIEDAVAMAARVPTAALGSVEVRPLMHVTDEP
ncbi:MAG: YciI family protein [Dehalococcoidia bacterium]